MTKERILNLYTELEINNKARLVIISVLLTLSMSLIYYGFAYSLNSYNLTTKLINKVRNDLGIEVSVEDSDITIFPTVSLHLKRVSTNNGIFIDNVLIKLGIFSTTENPKISSVNVGNMYINPKKLGIDDLSYHATLIKLSETNILANSVHIDKIWDTAVLNRIIVDNLEFGRSGNDTNVKFDLLNGIKYTNNLSYNSGDKTYMSKVDISNSNFYFTLTDKFNEKEIVDGDFTAKINNLSKAASDISPYLDLIINNSIASDEEAEISGKIVNDNKYLRIQQIKLVSPNIEAEGTYWVSSNNLDSDILDITLSKLNIPNLIGGDQIIGTATGSVFRLDRTNLRMLVTAPEIDAVKDKIQNFKLDCYGDGKSFKILSCSGDISSGGNFVLTGDITNNQYRPKFDGYITLTHKDINVWLKNQDLTLLTNNNIAPLYFISKIGLTPLDYELQDFRLILSGQTITGDIDVKFIGGIKQLIGSIQFESLDIDKTNIEFIKSSYNFLKSLGMEMFDETYATKYNILRSIPLKTTIDINIDDFKSSDFQLDRLSTLISYDSGLLKIHNYILSNGNKVNIGGYGEILATDIKPQIKFYVTDGAIVLDKFSDAEINSFIKYSKNNIDIASIGFASTGYLRNLTIGDTELLDTYWDVLSDNVILNVNKIDFKIFDGQVHSSGNIIFSPMKINLAYGVDGLSIEKSMTYLNYMFPFTAGNISINGQFSTTGTDFTDLLYNLYLDGNFLAKSTEVLNIDIDGAITKLTSANNGTIQLTPLFQECVSTGSTIFSEAKGAYVLDSGVLTAKNIALTGAKFNAASGFAMNFYDSTMDLNTIISFVPVSIRNVINASPIKLKLFVKGNINSPDKLLQFLDINDMYRMQRMMYGSEANVRRSR